MIDRLKITHVIPRYPYFSDDSVVGGAANALYNLMKVQSRSSDLTLITSVPGKGRPHVKNQFCTIHNLPIDLPGFTKKFGITFLKKFFLHTLRNGIETDLVHGHSGYIDYIIPSLYLALTKNRPLVYSLYCPVIQDSRNARYFGRTLVLSKLAKRAGRFIAISENVKRSMTKIGIEDSRISVIPPAIDLARFNHQIEKDAARKRLGLNPGELIILFVGNTHPTKNLETVIDVLALLKKEFPNIKLIITTELRNGESESRDRFIFNKISALNVSNHIQFLGIVDYMPDLMAAADLLLAPFLSTEGPSDYFMSALEAMAVGRPVVVSHVGGMPEVVDHGLGYLVDPMQVDQISSIVSRLLADPDERRAIGKTAAEFARMRFDPEVISKKHLAIYNEVLN